MLVVMEKTATQKQIDHVVTVVERNGFTARPIPGGDRVSIGGVEQRRAGGFGPVHRSSRRKRCRSHHQALQAGEPRNQKPMTP